MRQNKFSGKTLIKHIKMGSTRVTCLTQVRKHWVLPMINKTYKNGTYQGDLSYSSWKALVAPNDSWPSV